MSAEEIATTPVVVRARRLSALSRAKRQGDQEGQELGQVQTALNKLYSELIELSRVVDTHRKLERTGLSVSALPDLSAAAQRLQDQMDSVGRPSAQFLTARTKNVMEARAAIDESDNAIWRQWASEQIEALPVAVLPRMPALSRSQVESRMAGLRKLANDKPSVANIAQFQTSLGIVDDVLGSVEEASIDAVLRRFTDGRIRLAELSEEDLQTLRLDESLADQLYLHISS